VNSDPSSASSTADGKRGESSTSPVVSAEEQIERARVEDGGRLVDVDAV
jgi:hypothetical protein